MWQAFKDDIELNGDGFKNREEYENWVRAWVEDRASELGRIERFYLGTENPMDGLDIKIGEQNG